MGRRQRSRRGSGPPLVALLASVLTVTLSAVAPAAAQAPPPSVPGGRVELRAGPGDRDTFIPPPFRLDGVSAQASAQAAASASIQITYGSGFPTAARPPVQAALDVWAGLVTSSQPITVFVEYKSLGAGTLASAGPGRYFRDFDGAPVADTHYAQPLAEALSGQNLGGSLNDVDIDINIRNDWYFGTDGDTPSSQYDLMSVLLHEFLHGLGFLGTMTVTGSQGSWGRDFPRRPDSYERFTETAGGADLVNTSVYPNPSTALGNALQSGSVWFNSPRTNRTITDRVRLYAPDPWEPGSSFSHLDEDAYPAGSANSLGTPFLHSSEAVHAPGPLALCMLEAMGWSTPQDCTPPPPTAVVGFTWYLSGGWVGGGPNGTIIRAYATGGKPGATYKLVSGLDGGVSRPCMWETVPLNNTPRIANSGGFISTTAGALNRGPGRWQVCFREEGTGNTLVVTDPATFEVV